MQYFELDSSGLIVKMFDENRVIKDSISISVGVRIDTVKYWVKDKDTMALAGYELRSKEGLATTVENQQSGGSRTSNLYYDDNGNVIYESLLRGIDCFYRYNQFGTLIDGIRIWEYNGKKVVQHLEYFYEF